MMSDNINQTMRNIDADQNVLDELDRLKEQHKSLLDVYRQNMHLVTELQEQNVLLVAQGQEGWKLVPVEPTDDMIIAASDGYETGEVIGPSSCYRVMLAAAPALPKQVKSEDARDALAAIARGDARSIATADQCSHGKFGYEDCELCVCEFADAAISAQEEKD